MTKKGMNLITKIQQNTQAKINYVSRTRLPHRKKRVATVLCR